MAKFTKHVGELLSTGQKVVVIFRELPQEKDHCLVVYPDSLSNEMHNDLINEVDSLGAQQRTDFHDHANTHFFRDGRNMLEALHKGGHLQKWQTSKVMMTPTREARIRLDDLNDRLNGENPKTSEPPITNPIEKYTEEVVAGDEIKAPSVSQKNDNVLDDFSLAKGFISQADSMEAEAKRLRDQAYDLIPKRKLNNMLKKENEIA